MEIDKQKLKAKKSLGFSDEQDYIDHIKISETRHNRIIDLDLTKPYKYWQLLELCFSYYFIQCKGLFTIRQIYNNFHFHDFHTAIDYFCIIGFTNNYIYNEIKIRDKIKKHQIEDVYENVLFDTNIIKCYNCNAFEINKTDNEDQIIYDKQTKKLVNLLYHLNDYHKMRFTKILTIIKKMDI